MNGCSASKKTRFFKYFFVPLSFISLSCAGGGNIMTMGVYQDISIGSSFAQVQALVGKPSVVRNQAEGIIEYEYVERVKFGGRDVEERHYLIRVKDGEVISKQVQQKDPPGYLMDSYDMQTTQNVEESEELD